MDEGQGYLFGYIGGILVALGVLYLLALIVCYRVAHMWADVFFARLDKWSKTPAPGAKVSGAKPQAPSGQVIYGEGSWKK